MAVIRTLSFTTVLLLILAACGGPPAGTDAIPGGRKVADLIAAGSCPIEVAGVRRDADSLDGSFLVRLRNRSDAPVGDVRWGAVALDASGNALLDGTFEGGYDEEIIAPGETVDVELDIPREEAATAKVVIRSLTWYTPDPLGGDAPPEAHEWRNPLYGAQLHGAGGVPSGE